MKLSSPKIAAPSVARKPSPAELAEEKLRASPYYFLKRVDCEFAEGVLTLHGCVPIAQLARCAETIVARVEGVEAVINCIEIGEPFSAVPAARNAG
jgi:osmotically-inducible protein OsmY